jgi:hypothetical protein
MNNPAPLHGLFAANTMNIVALSIVRTPLQDELEIFENHRGESESGGRGSGTHLPG